MKKSFITNLISILALVVVGMLATQVLKVDKLQNEILILKNDLLIEQVKNVCNANNLDLVFPSTEVNSTIEMHDDLVVVYFDRFGGMYVATFSNESYDALIGTVPLDSLEVVGGQLYSIPVYGRNTSQKRCEIENSDFWNKPWDDEPTE